MDTDGKRSEQNESRGSCPRAVAGISVLYAACPGRPPLRRRGTPPAAGDDV